MYLHLQYKRNNMTTKTTYRVTFTQETIEGRKPFSSKWYASLHEAQTSKFVDFTNAKIEERTMDVLKFKPLAR